MPETHAKHQGKPDSHKTIDFNQVHNSNQIFNLNLLQQQLIQQQQAFNQLSLAALAKVAQTIGKEENKSFENLIETFSKTIDAANSNQEKLMEKIDKMTKEMIK